MSDCCVLIFGRGDPQELITKNLPTGWLLASLCHCKGSNDWTTCEISKNQLQIHVSSMKVTESLKGNFLDKNDQPLSKFQVNFPIVHENIDIYVYIHMHVCMYVCVHVCVHVGNTWYTISCISHVLYTNELSIYIETYVAQWYGMYYTYIHVQRSTHISYIYIIYIQIHGAWMAPRCWYQPGPCKNACKTGVIKMPQLRGKLSEVEAETLPHEVMDIPWGSIPWSPYHPWDWYIYHIYRWLTDFCGKCR